MNSEIPITIGYLEEQVESEINDFTMSFVGKNPVLLQDLFFTRNVNFIINS